MDPLLRKKILKVQQAETTEYAVYARLSARIDSPIPRDILQRIAEKERRHAAFWASHTGMALAPQRFKVWWYMLVAKIGGLTFGMKLMERDEEKAELTQEELAQVSSDAGKPMAQDEERELHLIDAMAEERLKYVGSMVLGLNDALVELTGALAGYTFALQSVRLIAATGLITGIAAALSMAASEYLSTKTEAESRKPLTASLYTGFVYLIAVLLLITPYFLFRNVYACLGSTILIAIGLIVVFTFYVSVAKGISFQKRFLEMAPLTLGIAAFTFCIGFLVRSLFHFEIG